MQVFKLNEILEKFNWQEIKCNQNLQSIRISYSVFSIVVSFEGVFETPPDMETSV